MARCYTITQRRGTLCGEDLPMPDPTAAAALAQLDDPRALEVLQRYAGRGPRYTSYPPATAWHEGADQSMLLDGLADLRSQPTPPRLSVYVHLPFCPSQCWFCACNVLITPRTDLQDPYVTALERELDMLQPHLPLGAEVVQLHWGGGSPSYLTPPQMRTLMAKLRQTFALASDAEIAIEVDPRITSEAHLQTLRELGFNRLSMGVQDIDDDVQVAIHRQQSLETTADFVQACRRHGFSSLNVDLIYGLPAQTEASFARTLDSVLAIDPDRVALYSYAHVPWLKPSQRRIDDQQIPGPALRFALFRHALQRFGGAGFEDIGLDHFAKPGDELAQARRNGTLQRNFMGYTTRAGAELVGVGLTAIGQVAGRFVQNERKLKSYYETIESGRLAVVKGYRLDRDDTIRQELIQQLMCQGRVDKRALSARYDIDFDTYFAAALAKLQPYAADGLIELGRDTLTATPLGRVLVRVLAMAFDAHLPQPGQAGPRFSATV
jgi:oxygen-independent coproporphyrinogen-3 oxidase